MQDFLIISLKSWLFLEVDSMIHYRFLLIAAIPSLIIGGNSIKKMNMLWNGWKLFSFLDKMLNDDKNSPIKLSENETLSMNCE